MVPTDARLYVNPASDARFVAIVQAAFARGVDVGGLQDAIRAAYPRAIVRASVLSGRPLTWYVYRDGAWLDGRA